eukprot:4249942-Amphidinium_carterae.1
MRTTIPDFESLNTGCDDVARSEGFVVISLLQGALNVRRSNSPAICQSESDYTCSVQFNSSLLTLQRGAYSQRQPGKASLSNELFASAHPCRGLCYSPASERPNEVSVKKAELLQDVDRSEVVTVFISFGLGTWATAAS